MKGRKATKKGRSSPKWCPDCGFHIRGSNHAEGTHHKTKRKG